MLTGEQAEQWRRLANLPNDSAKSLMEAKLGEGENIADEVQIAQLFRQAVDKAERGDSELNPVGGKHVATAIKDWVRKEWARLKGQII